TQGGRLNLFQCFIQQFRRPVLVVIDDLDRCDPKFVVDLIRGVQTVLQSPRIVFVLLGDRDWIEQAFVDQNQAMKDIDVGKEHEFGARFVEKAIQLSFVLPDIKPDDRKTFVRNLLRGDALGDDRGEASSDPDALTFDPLQGLEEQSRATVVEASQGVRSAPDFESRARQTETALASLKALDLEAEQLAVAEREVRASAALGDATDTSATRAVEEKLVQIGGLLPANPRQITRIINTLSLFQSVASIQHGITPLSEDWEKLARWIILMVEWPKTWFTLSRNPELIDKLQDPKGWPTDRQPKDKAEALAKRIMDDQNAFALINMKTGFAKAQLGDEGVENDWDREPLKKPDLLQFIQIIPPTSGSELVVEVPEEEQPA
ncbi:MAG: P-loop NTPase fold protein, partial [Pseudomonadota bacterium]